MENLVSMSFPSYTMSQSVALWTLRHLHVSITQLPLSLISIQYKSHCFRHRSTLQYGVLNQGCIFTKNKMVLLKPLIRCNDLSLIILIIVREVWIYPFQRHITCENTEKQYAHF